MNQGPPDPHAPGSQPTRQGRRLIRMLFRSGVEDVKTSSSDLDSRAEDSATNPQENVDKHVALAPVPTGKFASLKRKLFPSQNRRHPRHVPPLIISPISAPTKNLLPPLEVTVESLSRKATSSESIDQNQTSECFSSKTTGTARLKSEELELGTREETPESDFSTQAECDNNWRATGRRTLIDDDDDRDLESAVEALDLESSTAEKTLEEMSRAINDLRVWKEVHEQATHEALRKMQAEQELLLRSAERQEHHAKCDDRALKMELELKRQQQQRDREEHTLELRKEAEAYQLECNLFRTTLDKSDAARVEQALQSSGDSEGLALSRLRNELFQLDVKQRQEALLQELQGADNELEMMVDVQAFTGELDAILAQFDDAGIDESAGCVATEG